MYTCIYIFELKLEVVGFGGPEVGLHLGFAHPRPSCRFGRPMAHGAEKFAAVEPLQPPGLGPSGGPGGTALRWKRPFPLPLPMSASRRCVSRPLSALRREWRPRGSLRAVHVFVGWTLFAPPLPPVGADDGPREWFGVRCCWNNRSRRRASSWLSVVMVSAMREIFACRALSCRPCTNVQPAASPSCLWCGTWTIGLPYAGPWRGSGVALPRPWHRGVLLWPS